MLLLYCHRASCFCPRTVRLLQGASAATGVHTAASHTSRLSPLHIASTSRDTHATNNYPGSPKPQCLQTHMLELLPTSRPLHSSQVGARFNDRPGSNRRPWPASHSDKCTQINSSHQLLLQQTDSWARPPRLRLPASRSSVLCGATTQCTSHCVSSRSPILYLQNSCFLWL